MKGKRAKREPFKAKEGELETGSEKTSKKKKKKS